MHKDPPNSTPLTPPSSTSQLLQTLFTANKKSVGSTRKNPDSKPPTNQPVPVDPFKLPVGSHLAHFTPTERIFKLGTTVESRGLTIKTNEEFYLFMDMRARHQWISSSMSSLKWVNETANYNKELQALTSENNIQPPVDKYPSALMNKLASIMAGILNWLSKPESPNYKSECIRLLSGYH